MSGEVMSQGTMGRAGGAFLSGSAPLPYAGASGGLASNPAPAPPGPTDAMGQVLQDQARALECLLALEGKLYAAPGPPTQTRTAAAPANGPISLQLLIEVATHQARELACRAQILLERI